MGFRVTGFRVFGFRVWRRGRAGEGRDFSAGPQALGRSTRAKRRRTRWEKRGLRGRAPGLDCERERGQERCSGILPQFEGIHCEQGRSSVSMRSLKAEQTESTRSTPESRGLGALGAVPAAIRLAEEEALVGQGGGEGLRGLRGWIASRSQLRRRPTCPTRVARALQVRCGRSDRAVVIKPNVIYSCVDTALCTYNTLYTTS